MSGSGALIVPNFEIRRSTPISHSFRVARVQSAFDIPRADEAVFTLDGALPIDEREWRIGLVCGPSGSGKTQLAQELWPDAYCRPATWDRDAAVVDGFPEAMSADAVMTALTAAGFSSSRDWVKPFRVLSNGQQFRAELARAVACHDFAVFDEFTSTVNREVARAASIALSKWLRRSPGKRFVAVSCHDDIADWLEADWLYRTDTGAFFLRGDHGRSSFCGLWRGRSRIGYVFASTTI